MTRSSQLGAWHLVASPASASSVGLERARRSPPRPPHRAPVRSYRMHDRRAHLGHAVASDQANLADHARRAASSTIRSRSRCRPSRRSCNLAGRNERCRCSSMTSASFGDAASGGGEASGDAANRWALVAHRRRRRWAGRIGSQPRPAWSKAPCTTAKPIRRGHERAPRSRKRNHRQPKSARAPSHAPSEVHQKLTVTSATPPRRRGRTSTCDTVPGVGDLELFERKSQVAAPREARPTPSDTSAMMSFRCAEESMS